MILASFAKVFPNAIVVRGNQSTKFPVLGLIAKRDGSAWDSRLTSASLASVPPSIAESDPIAASYKTLVLGEIISIVFDDADTNTLVNLELEIAAGNDWILADLRQNKPASTLDNGYLSGPLLFPFYRHLQNTLLRPISRRLDSIRKR